MQREKRLLYLFALIKLILPFLLQNGLFELQRDEYLYLAEGRHLAWGYMEVPPLLSVFAWFTHLFGDGIFWVKFWPALFSALTYIVTGKIILSLGGKSFALTLAFFSFVFGYMRISYLFQPNAPEIFFCASIAYGVVRYIQTGKNSWLYITGICCGLGLENKYSIAFFIFSLLAGLALTRQRKIFLNRHLYYAAAIALFIFFPNIIWQFANHFPLAHHMKLLQQNQLQYISPVSFLIDQLLIFFPCFVWIIGLLFVSAKAKGKDYRFYGLTYAFMIILLLVFHGKNYYSQGLYPALFAFGSYYIEAMAVRRFKIYRYALLAIVTGFGIWITPIALPIFSPEKLAAFYKKNNTAKFGVLRWEDLKDHALPMDFADMLGWGEMTQKVSAAYNSLDSNEKKQTILFCDNYGQAGAVNYYGRKYNLPGAYSADASYLYWLPDTMHIVNMILVTDDPDEMHHAFIKNFSSAAVSDSITNPYARERGSLIIILKGANEEFNKGFNRMIEKKRTSD